MKLSPTEWRCPYKYFFENYGFSMDYSLNGLC